MSADTWWVTPVLWIGSIGALVALVLFASAPRGYRKMGRGGFSVQHLLTLNTVWEPGKKYVFEQKQEQHEDGDDEGGSGADDDPKVPSV
jgi:hypothetical protein